jgi:DNA polymerase
MTRASAADLIPPDATWENLRGAAAGCRACDLWRKSTQTVFGECPAGEPGRAAVMLVGEQPGNDEDLAGRPFVGPAGQLLDRALEQAAIDRSRAYVTNVVKHFKWEPRGKRRIHAKPNALEIAACLPWLEAELKAIQPYVLVLLGATAAQAILGRDFRVTRTRGEFIPSDLAPFVLATVHPSSILRARDSAAREAEMARFIEDLAKAGRVVPAMARRAR